MVLFTHLLDETLGPGIILESLNIFLVELDLRPLNFRWMRMLYHHP